MPYEQIDHTGDIGIHVTAPTREELFVDSARAMTEIIADPAAIRTQRTDELVVEGEDAADLLRAWLGELLYRFSGDGMIYRDFRIVSLDDRRLKATAAGEAYNADRHPLRTELKAVTYHQLKVDRTPQGWEAQVIFDV